ncbi:MAG TPA: coiled-coil domain-containing protein [Lichenihabitans sp.]|jgi:cytochrome c556|nr:coiled-coil domain-containing protein [Lichenihabitans sp.]
MTLALDTLAIVRRLQAAGFPEGQAEAVSTVIRDTHDTDLGTLATKADLESLRAATKTDFDGLRAATKTDLDSLRAATKADLDSLRAATKTDLESLRAATKTDLDSLRATTKADLRETELRLEARIEAVKSDIIKWVFGAIGFQTVVIVGAAITIARLFVK